MIHELGLADGDLGHEYWHQVGKLLKRAAGMQLEIDSLTAELEPYRAMHPSQIKPTPPRDAIPTSEA
jgi:hypothetical protein